MAALMLATRRQDKASSLKPPRGNGRLEIVHMTLLAILAGLVLVWWAAKTFGGSDPAKLKQNMKSIGGIVALLAGAAFGLTGRIDAALLLAGVGAWLIGYGARPSWLPQRGGGRSTTIRWSGPAGPGGERRGTVLAGAFAGSDLDNLGPSELLSLLDECRRGDPQAAALLEPYLDRRLPGWRQHADADPDPRGGTGGVGRFRGMTEEEAYEVLGLRAGAGLDEVRAAHRALIKKIHPDQGGTNDLAARVNMAKDVLARRHR